MTLCDCLFNRQTCSHYRSGETHTFVLTKNEFTEDEVRQTITLNGQTTYEANYVVRDDKSLIKIEELIYESNSLVQKNTFFHNGKTESSESYLNGLLHGSRFEMDGTATICQTYIHGVIQTETCTGGENEYSCYYINGNQVIDEEYHIYHALRCLPLPIAFEIYDYINLGYDL